MRRLSILVLVLLAAFDVPENLGNPMDPLTWAIGPIINGQNYSHGMPLRPTANPGGGWYFDFPQADGVHYVTRAPTEVGRRSVRMVFEIQGDATFKEVAGAVSKTRARMDRRLINRSLICHRRRPGELTARCGQHSSSFSAFH